MQSFNYDALDRLISAGTTGVGNGQYSESYQYNAIGNITSTSRLGNYYYPASGPTSVRPHAATSAGSNQYTYDNNGNMLTRVEVSGTQRITYTQAWDVENRLVAVTNTVTLTVTRFYYDGDGQRVKKVESKNTTSMTTAYLGALFEKNITTGVTTTYYFAGATRVAMRQASAVYYLHGDHLGSASLTTNASGAKYGELRYKPYGETRYIWGATPTDRRFTGQLEESGLGSLYDYGARRYSPVLGRFLSADTMVPSPGNPQSLNRYSYVLNNALKYTDPTGHMECDPNGVCTRPTSDGSYIIVRGGSEYPNYVEKAIANAVLSGDPNYLNALPGGPGLPMEYAMADVEMGLGYRPSRLGVPDTATALGAAVILPRDDDIFPAESIPSGERLEYTQTPRDAATGLVGMKVYRVWGSDINNPDVPGSGAWGHSWTPVGPNTVLDYRGSAALPSGGESGVLNTGRFVSEGTIVNSYGITVRPALTLDGNPGGLTECRVPNPETQINLVGVYGVNPPY